MPELLLEHEPGEDQHRIRATIDSLLTQDEVDEIGLSIQETVERIGRRRSTKPHIVHVKPTYEDVPVMIGSPAGEVQAMIGSPAGEVQAKHPTTGARVFEQRQTNRPLHCPDCRRPLLGHTVKGIEHLACPGTDRTIEPCHGGCVVACGVTE